MADILNLLHHTMEVLLYQSTICRLCAEENSNGLYIFSNDDSENNLCNNVNKYLPIKISNDEKFPCTICPGCNIQLEATIQFLDLVTAGQVRLRQLLKNQQDEMRKLQRDTDNGNISPTTENCTVQTIIVNDGNTEGDTEVVVQLIQDGPLYPPDHEQCLKIEGLEKPRRKRGRPPKASVFSEEKIEITESVAESSKEQKSQNEDDEEFDADGRKKRRRKVPTRYKEAVQGKELERMFREEGVIDGNESCGDDDDSPTVKIEETIEPIKHEPEVIGHLESKEGRDLGELIVITKSRGRGRPKTYKRRFRYTCEICGRGFLHYGRFKLHKSVHKNVKYECTDCSDRFDSKTKLQEHQTESKHAGEVVVEGLENEVVKEEENDTAENKKIACEQCHKTFVTKQSWEVHVKAIHEGKKPFACEQCGKTFAYAASLKGHLASHDVKGTEKLFPCDECNKVLNHPSSVVYHKQSEHNNGRRFVCNKCNKSFKHKQLLQRHQLVHTDKRPYNCNECGAQFKARANLLNHKLTHSGVKKHYCDICGQQFAHKTSLTLHYRWHQGHKPFRCSFCDKTFSQKGNLQEHMRIHTGEKPFCCNVCGRRFTTSSQYRLHVKRHTGERPWACEICDKRFLHKDTWKCHTRRHLGQRPFQCTSCKRAFTEHWALKKHMRLHTGEKPYVCDICDRAFADCSNLSKHKKAHLTTTVKNAIWENLAASAASTVNTAATGTLFKADEGSNDELKQIFYVSYQDLNETTDSQTLQIETDVNNKLQIVENCNEKSLIPEQLNLTVTDMHLPPGPIQVTDEEGNPINITTQDGSQLRVTTYDGEHLQVTTLDGTTLPIELNVQNGNAYIRKEILSTDENTTEDLVTADPLDFSDLTKVKDIESLTEEALNEEHTIEFLTQDGRKMRLVTYGEGSESEYLTIV